MPSWIYYLILFFLGAGGNYAMAYFCNMEKPCLPLGASIVLGIILGLAIGLGYIDGRIDRED